MARYGTVMPKLQMLSAAYLQPSAIYSRQAPPQPTEVQDLVCPNYEATLAEQNTPTSPQHLLHQLQQRLLQPHQELPSQAPYDGVDSLLHVLQQYHH